MSFWRSPHGRGILLILVSTVCFSFMEPVIKHAMTLAPAFMLLWFRYTFQAVAALALQWPRRYSLSGTAASCWHTGPGLC